MAVSNYERALPLVLADEGGYVNHPRDPGGATNRGVTQRVYHAFRRAEGLPTRSVRHITEDEVATIYRLQYWDAVRGDELARGLDYCLFDYAVNSGPHRAIKELQRAVRVKVDGHFGVLTFGAVRGVNDVAGLVNEICDRRMSFLRRLGHWKTFRRGWTRRVAGVREAALAMI